MLASSQMVHLSRPLIIPSISSSVANPLEIARSLISPDLNRSIIAEAAISLAAGASVLIYIDSPHIFRSEGSLKVHVPNVWVMDVRGTPAFRAHEMT